MKVCMIGTGGSGKTAYLYLMLKRIVIGPENCTIDPGDSHVHQEIDMNRWPRKTDYLQDDGTFKPNILRINRTTRKGPCSVNIPDISGAFFEDLDEMLKEINKGNRKIGPSLFNNDPMHKDQHNILRYIEGCGGIILLIDLQLERENKDEEWRRHLFQTAQVLNLIRKQVFLPDSPSKYRRPLMIVLSKSDLLKDDRSTPGMFDAGEKVHDYLVKIGGQPVIAAAKNLYEEDCIIYAMHSSVVATKSAGKEGKILPDYQACFNHPYDEYTKQFMLFLERLNDK